MATIVPIGNSFAKTVLRHRLQLLFFRFCTSFQVSPRVASFKKHLTEEKAAKVQRGTCPPTPNRRSRQKRRKNQNIFFLLNANHTPL